MLQEVVSVHTNDLLPAIASIINQQQKVPNYKVIIFLTTARMTGYMASFFTAMNIEVMEIHSRLTQSKRSRVSEKFRQAMGGAILFSSDVSARGMVKILCSHLSVSVCMLYIRTVLVSFEL